MERKQINPASLLLWAVVAALLSQNLVLCAAKLEDQKTYYSPPDPHTGTPPSGHGTPTPYHGGGSPSTPTPYHGGGSPSTPTPYHGGGGPSTPTPSHGGGGHRRSPPTNCGNPPSHHHNDPSPPRGGGYYHSPPTSTPTPSTPTYTPTPTTPTYTPTPTTPTPSTPTYTPTPSTPTPTTPTYTPTPTTPTTPIDPGTPNIPGTTIPSPPFSFDPNSPPFSCNYWRNHPTLIWGLFGFWGTTLGGAFGGIPSVPGVASSPGIGSTTNLLEALSNTRTDGYGNLYREGTAALLNSMMHTNGRFPLSTTQVRDSFVSALASNQAAATQAQVFKQANEGRIHHKV